MDAKTLKSRLTLSDIKIILKSLNATIWDEDNEQIILSTKLCHGGDSVNKLYYFKNEGYFYCQTHCHGEVDILKIVCNMKNINLTQAINYICTLLGISDIKYGFADERIEIISDWDFINTYNLKYTKFNKNDGELKPINKSKLNMFQKIYTTEWVKDGISVDSMNKYNILYSTLKQSIIIPHYDINNNLVGIRQRNLLDIDINNFGKYTPFSMCGEMYNHKLKLNLYGIHNNKEAIIQKKKVMLVESEKSVLQCDSLFQQNNFTLGLCGCSELSNCQINLLLSLKINEVIIALDKQFKEKDDDEYKKWMKHLREKIINPLLPYFKIYVLWDTDKLLGYKDSPTDKGKDTLLKLMKNKIYINS